MKNVLVVGADGFLGSNICDTFVRNSNFSTYGIVTSLNKSLKRLESNIQLYQMPGSEQQFVTIFNQLRPHFVIYCAVSYSENEQESAEVNYFNQLNYLKYSIRFNSEAFLSFNTFFTKMPNTFSHMNTYVKYKRRFKNTVFSADYELQNLKFISLLLFHVYGKKDKKFINKVVDDLKNNKQSILLSNCEQEKDFIHVNDVSRAILHICNDIEAVKKRKNELEIGSGSLVKLKDLLLLIKRKLNSNSELIFGAIPSIKGEINTCANIQALTEMIEWRPTISLDEGIKELIE